MPLEMDTVGRVEVGGKSGKCACGCLFLILSYMMFDVVVVVVVLTLTYCISWGPEFLKSAEIKQQRETATRFGLGFLQSGLTYYTQKL